MMSVNMRNSDNTEFTSEAIKELLYNADWPLSTTEVADEFNVTQQGAYYRLSKLNENGEVEKRKISSVALWRV